MFLKNLLRRKTRTLLTILGISIGVAAIIALGALADSLQSGYSAMITGSKADLLLSQPDAYDLLMSAVDQSWETQIAAAPEVSAIEGMLEGFVQAEDEPFFFVFGHPAGSFALSRYQVIEGVGLDSREARSLRGEPILLGSAAAEVMDKQVGDSLRLTGSMFRVVGIYQTGDAFEDSGAVLELENAQQLLGRQRQVSLFYVRLKDRNLRDRFIQRVERQWPDLAVSGADETGSKSSMQDIMQGYVWAIGGLAILIGGVGMMNAQLMSVMERTREIGVLRAIGWGSGRVLWMILSESVFVSLFGGLLGIGIGWLMIDALSKTTVTFGLSARNIDSQALTQAFSIVFILGIVGGLYPAWRAARMQPIEALRYEGGSSGAKIHRLPVGGMAVQSLWQRSMRTLLTLSAIGLTVGAIIALEATVNGALASFGAMFTDTHNEVMLRQADVSDSSQSAIDERIGDKVSALPGVESLEGMVFTAIAVPETGGFFIIQGYPPGSRSIQRFRIVEGQTLTTNHQIILGKMMAESTHKKVGDTIDLSGVRFRVVGIYESGISWEEIGGVVSLRDGQVFVGRPHKVTMYSVKLSDPSQAPQIVERVNREFPEVHAALAGEFVDEMPDFENSQRMLNSISLLAVLVGGVGVLNTMLMSVFERTREIGVLRALGWRRRSILGLILREALLLGILGGLAGIGIALGITYLMAHAPMIGAALSPAWDTILFVRAIGIAIALGIAGGLYPAFRATRLQPVEALHYE